MALQQPGLNNLLLEFVGNFVEILVHVRVFLGEQLVPMIHQHVPAGFAYVLVVGIHSGLRLIHGGFHNLVEQLLIKISVGIVELGLANLGNHPVDQLHLLLVFLMGQLNGAEHGVVVHLVGAGFDHDHFLARGHHGHVQIGNLSLLAGGIEHQFTVHQANLQRTHRAIPGMSEMASAAEVPIRAAISGEQSWSTLITVAIMDTSLRKSPGTGDGWDGR